MTSDDARRERRAAWKLLQLESLSGSTLTAVRIAGSSDDRRSARSLLEAVVEGVRPWTHTAHGALELLAGGEPPDGVVLRGDDAYPAERLDRLADPPWGLFLKGDVAALSRKPAVAIVGARRARADSLAIASTIAGDLARAGAVIVSGLALGVDAAAHHATVKAGAKTIAVLGSGSDVIHPRRNVPLASRIVDSGGLLVSEYLPHLGARARNFPHRNRIIAALSDLVIVVQAARRSGALHTADFAQQVGVEVAIVPGAPDDPEYHGSTACLRDGAPAVLDAAGAIRIMTGAAIDCSTLTCPFAPKPSGDDDASSWDAVLRHPVTADEIATRTGSSIAEVHAQLLEMVLAGDVERLQDGRYQRV